MKPDHYPDDRSARAEFEWTTYDKYYSDTTLHKPYFYHDLKREGRFVDCLAARFEITPGSTLLDVGCGNGFYSHLFAERGVRVTAVDKSERAVEYCKTHHGPSCEWLCDDAFALDRAGQFDFAFCFWFMYFNAFEQLNAGAEDARRLMAYLKPGGRLFFLWHSDLTAIRLPPERFSVMNYTLAQLRQLFPSYETEEYAVDTPAAVCALLGRHSFNKYVSRLSCARVMMQASSWKRARLLIVAHQQR